MASVTYGITYNSVTWNVAGLTSGDRVELFLRKASTSTADTHVETATGTTLKYKWTGLESETAYVANCKVNETFTGSYPFTTPAAPPPTYYTLTITHTYNYHSGGKEESTKALKFVEGSNITVLDHKIDKPGFGDAVADPTTVYMDSSKKATITYSQVLPQLYVTADDFDHGTVTVDSTTIEEGTTFYYDWGTTIKVSANPDSESIFDGWNFDESAPASTTYTVPDKSHGWSFLIGPYMRYPILTCSASPSGSGTVSPTRADVPKGDSKTVTATDTSMWQFNRWSDGGLKSHSVVIDADTSLTAYFKIKSFNWTNIISSSQPISNLIADDWWRIQDIIDLIRGTAYSDWYRVTSPTCTRSGGVYTVMTAEIFNQVRDRITLLPGYGNITSRKSIGEPILASYFDGNGQSGDTSIRAALNRAINNY